MLTLLNSYWFIALGSLLIPLFIHLWNKKQPVRIKIGSLKWLSASVNTKSRSLQFQDWPLLLLRCLLLTFLVLYLVNPVWQRNTQNKPKRYAWIAPDLLQKQHLPLLQNTLDTLINQDVELRYFNFPFKLISKEGWDSIKTGETRVEKTTQLNYWLLAQRVNENFADAAEHIIFTSDQLRHFSGNRPTLPPHLKWVSVPFSETKTWVQAAYVSAPDSITFYTGNTSANGTTFKQTIFTYPKTTRDFKLQDNPGYTFIYDPLNPHILDNATKKKTPVTTKPLSIGIFYAPDRKVDASYLNKVVRALSNFNRRQIKLELYTNSTKINPPGDFLFWLSDEAIPPNLLAKISSGLYLLKDSSKKSVSTTPSWVKIPGLPETIPLQRQTVVSQDKFMPVWQNNFGESVLHFKPQGKGGIYYFGSRFNMQWNDLAGSSFFPEIMGSVVWPESIPEFDNRTINHLQIRPIAGKTKASNIISTASFQDLKYWCLILGALLFITERIWVSRKGKVIL